MAFHILTPYPTTGLHRRMTAPGRLLHRNWDLYDTRHAVYQPARLAPAALEAVLAAFGRRREIPAGAGAAAVQRSSPREVLDP